MIGMVTSAVRETMTNAMLTTEAERDRAQQQRLPEFFLSRSRVHDRIGERHRAQREFLALVDIILDEDAARIVGRRA